MQTFNHSIHEATLGFHIQNTFGIFLDIEQLSVQHEYNQEEINEYESISKNILKGNVDDEQIMSFFNKLRLISTYEHETKHFHDLFLTPIGSYVIITDFQLLMNFESLISLYSTANGFEIKIPIYESMKTKVDLISNEVDIVKWFNIRLTETNTLLQNSNVLFNEIITTSDLLEASATLIEVQAMYTIFGKYTSEFYLLYLLSNNKNVPKIYTKILSILYYQLNIRELNLIHKIIIYSLCGDFTEGENSYPANRFCELVKYIHDDLDGDYHKRIDNFFIDKKYTKPFEALQVSQEAINKIINQLDRKISAYPLESVNESLLEQFQYCKDYFKLREQIISNREFLPSYIDLGIQIVQHFEDLKPTIYYIGEKKKDVTKAIKHNDYIKKHFDVLMSIENHPVLLRAKFSEASFKTDTQYLQFAVILNIALGNKLELELTNTLYLIIAEYFREKHNLYFIR